MEQQKDNNLKDTLLPIGQIKNSLETMDKSLLQSAKRAGNIVTALYIVSNVLPYDEPLQKEIRKASLVLLSVANDIAGTKGENFDRKTAELNSIIKKIISYLEVGVTMFLVSEMNFRILRLELMALGGSYDSRRSGLVDVEVILKQNHSHKSEEQTEINPKSVNERTKKDSPKDLPIEKDKGHIKDIRNKITQPISISVLNKPILQSFGAKNFFKDKSTDLNDRKTLILEALKNKDSSNISDIKVKFPNVSFKTIQRDLQSLIDEEKIERIGERRWSTYRIK